MGAGSTGQVGEFLFEVWIRGAAADLVQRRARMRHRPGHRTHGPCGFQKSASVLSTQPDGSCAHGGKSMRPPRGISRCNEDGSACKEATRADLTLGELFAALASSRPDDVRENEPTLSGGAKPSFRRGWSSASAVFCAARSRHAAAVSMVSSVALAEACKQMAGDGVCQNRTPRKEKPRRSGAGVRSVMKVSGRRAFPPTHGRGVRSDARGNLRPTRRGTAVEASYVGLARRGHRCQRTVSNR